VAGDSGFAASKAERVREAGGTLDQRTADAHPKGKIAERRNKRRRVYTKRRCRAGVRDVRSGKRRQEGDLTVFVRRT
jgi:hypothetical protein